MKRDPANEVVFACPFCGLRASTHPVTDDNPGYVTHALPGCHHFRELEPYEYLKAVNNKLMQKKGLLPS